MGVVAVVEWSGVTEYDSKNVGVHTVFIDEFCLAVAHTPTLPPREREGK